VDTVLDDAFTVFRRGTVPVLDTVTVETLLTSHAPGWCSFLRNHLNVMRENIHFDRDSNRDALFERVTRNAHVPLITLGYLGQRLLSARQ